MDKERLYEENMALKLKNNNLLQELLKLRTKVAQVERELAKKEDTTETSQFSKPAHMINNLKSAVKELKTEVSLKDEEIHKLRKNIKSTKLNEIELEVQAYIDECTRLRHHLEEIMRQRNTPPISQVLENEKSLQGTFNASAVRKENEELSQALNQANQENSRLRAKIKEIEKEKKKNQVKKNEISQLKGENIKLKSKAEQYSRELAQKEASFKEEISKIKRNLNEAYAKINNSEGKVKDLICENEEKNRQIKFLQENKTISRKDVSDDKKKEEKIKETSPSDFKPLSKEKIVTSVKQNHEETKDTLLKSNVKSKEDLGIQKKNDIDKPEQLELLDESSSEKASQSLEKQAKMQDFSESDSYDEKFDEFEEVKIKDPVPLSTSSLPSSKINQESANEKINQLEKNSEEYSEDQEDYLDDQEFADQNIRKENHSKESSDIRESATENEENAKMLEKAEKSEKVEKSEKAEKPKKSDHPKKVEKIEKSEKIETVENSEKIEKAGKSSKVQKDEKGAEKPKPINNEESKTLDDKKKTDHSEKPLNPEKPSEDPQTLNKKSKKSSKGKKGEKKATNSPSSLFRHLALRLQINRIPRAKAVSVLFKPQSSEKPISSSEVLSMLKSPPLSFTEEESKALCSSLCDSNKTSLKSLEEKLISLTENWEIYSPEEEEQIDDMIGEAISNNKDPLLEACASQDPSSQGTISLSVFKKALTKLKIKLPEKVLKYMQLLFYSHNMNLDEVPYLNFIKAYTEQGEENDNDEEKAKVARHYLAIIAQILIQNSRTVFDVFECDEAGLISPDNFFAGLQRMGLEEMDEEHVMVLLEALQFDQAQEVCVHIEELEEILNHYGVDKEEEQGHQKKVSMLDSGNYELSEDSRERTLRKESDKGISDNSPFTKNQGVEEEYDEDFN